MSNTFTFENGNIVCLENDVEVPTPPFMVAPSFAKGSYGKALVPAITVCGLGLRTVIIKTDSSYFVQGISILQFGDCTGGMVIGGSSLVDSKRSNVTATGGCKIGGNAVTS